MSNTKHNKKFKVNKPSVIEQVEQGLEPCNNDIVTKGQSCWDYLRCHFREYLETLKNIAAIKIQALWRGFHVRRLLMALNDNMTYDIMIRELTRYNNNMIETERINELLSKKKIRHENFPSHISENIAKFVIFKKYGIMPCWDTDKGDIILNKQSLFKQIEVKGFMSDGPSSFGPTECWDWIYFVDARDTQKSCFKVYEIKLSNKSDIFRNIKITKKESYGEQCDRKVRPHCGFEKIFKPQLGEHCKLIFGGHISELDNAN
jgi:hypothetical protein